MRSAPTGYYIEPTDRPLATTVSPLTLPLLEIKMARSAPTGYYLEPTDPDIPTAVSSSHASVRFLIPNQFPHLRFIVRGTYAWTTMITLDQNPILNNRTLKQRETRCHAVDGDDEDSE